MPQLLVAHDFVCPWCWAAIRQAERLNADFPTLSLRWVGFELLPEGLTYTSAPKDPDAAKKPRIPTRFELLLEADGLTIPIRNGKLSNSRMALEGAEFAWEAGRQHEYIWGVYNAYWEQDRDISNRAVLEDVAEKAGLDVEAFLTALGTRIFQDRVVEFDDPAHEAGIWNVPTWKFTEAWVAEQPYRVVSEMAARFATDLE